MAKRGAQSTLDHMNWNEADVPEEAGEFAKASEDVIKQRVIKKARRRVVGDADSSAAATTSSVFGGFKGFQSTPLTKSTDDKAGSSKTFSFLATLGANSNGTAAAGSVTSSGAVGSTSTSASTSASSSAAPTFSFGSNAGAPATVDAAKTGVTFGSSASLKADSTAGGNKPSAAGFGISSTKDDAPGENKNLFSFGTNPAKPQASTFGEAGAKAFSFGSVAATKPAATGEATEKTFTFGSPSTGNEAAFASAAKGTFSFGSLAGKNENSAESGTTVAGKDAVTSPKSTFTFGKADTASALSASKGTFSFGSVPPKADTVSAGGTFSFAKSPAPPDSVDAGLPKSTFSFGSIPPKKDATGKTESSSAKVASKDTSAASTPKNTFSFASPTSQPTAATKSTFSFGSIPPKSGIGETAAGAGKETTTGSSPKSNFTFGSLAAGKSDSPASSIAKGTFSFGSIPPKADAKEAASDKSPAGTPKSTPSFGGTIPSNVDKLASGDIRITFGASAAAKAGATDSEKKSYSFGVPAGAGGSIASVDKKSYSFGAAKENAEDTIKKMFNFGAPPDEGKSAPTSRKGEDESAASKKPKPFGGFGSVSGKGTGSTFGSKPTTGDSETKKKKAQAKFQADVIRLNQTFVEWVSSKVKENPYCMLQRVFHDYQRHFRNLWDEREAMLGGESLPPLVRTSQTEQEKTKGPAKEKQSQPAKEKTVNFSFAVPAATTSSLASARVKPAGTAGASPSVKPAGTAGASANFTFGSSASKPSFTFGSGASGGIGSSSLGAAKPSPPAASFGTPSVPTSSPSFFAGASTFYSKPGAGTGTTSLFGAGPTPASSGGITFGNVVKPATDSTTTNDGEAEGDEDEPPKVEFTPVEEKDSLYSKRCKLFVKAGGAFSDRGVGTLHIKKVDSKVQVLLRAETSLGNILLNIILNETVPLQRMGKNNVMMVCLPTPESKPPPTSVLLRVKTAEEADELHETLLKYKPK